jgi:hypothetical protein
MEIPLLTAAVITTEMSEQSDLRSELSLSRSAALYADRIILISPAADEVEGAVGRKRNLNEDQIRQLLQREQPALYEKLAAAPDPAALLGRIRAEVGRGQLTGERAVGELTTAAEMGLVEWRHPPPSEDGDSFAALVDTMVSLLGDPTVHAICDASAAKLIDALAEVDERMTSLSVQRRHREAELGTGLIARLPAFPQLPLDELLDLKAELSSPLARYRAAVGRLERELSQEDSFGAVARGDMDAEIAAVWRNDAAPALVELQEALEQHELVRELGRSAASSARDLVVSGASLSVALATVADVAAVVSAAAALTGMGIQTAINAALGRSETRRVARRADFYYLYRLGTLRIQPR